MTRAVVASVQKRHFLRHLYIKTIILPRQARDKHRESTQKRVVAFFAGGFGTWVNGGTSSVQHFFV
jgi:hypothetical protein